MGHTEILSLSTLKSLLIVSLGVLFRVYTCNLEEDRMEWAFFIFSGTRYPQDIWFISLDHMSRLFPHVGGSESGSWRFLPKCLSWPTRFPYWLKTDHNMDNKDIPTPLRRERSIKYWSRCEEKTKIVLTCQLVVTNVHLASSHHWFSPLCYIKGPRIPWHSIIISDFAKYQLLPWDFLSPWFV